MVYNHRDTLISGSIRVKIDLHVHTGHSYDATGTPEEVLARSSQAGLNGIAVTEHNSYEKTDAFLELAPRYNLVVFSGAEVPTINGHYLVFTENIGHWNRYCRMLHKAQEIIDEVNRLGGAVIAAHPYRLGLGYGGQAVTKLRDLTAIEVYNGGNNRADNKLALELAAKLNLPGTGGSDAHCISDIGRCYTEFFSPLQNLAELITALKSGNYRAVNNEVPAR